MKNSILDSTHQPSPKLLAKRWSRTRNIVRTEGTRCVCACVPDCKCFAFQTSQEISELPMISKDLYLFLLPLNNKNKNISIQRALYSQYSLVRKLRQENSRKENIANMRHVEHIHAVLHCWKASIGTYETSLKKHMKKPSIQGLFLSNNCFPRACSSLGVFQNSNPDFSIIYNSHCP